MAWAVRNQGGASKEAVVVTQEVNCLCRYTCEEHFELLPPTPQAGSRPAPEVWRGLQVGLPALCILPALSPPPLPPLFPAFSYLDRLLRTGSWTPVSGDLAWCWQSVLSKLQLLLVQISAFQPAASQMVLLAL